MADSERMNLKESDHGTLFLCFLLEMKMVHKRSYEISLHRLHRMWKEFLVLLDQYIVVQGFEEMPGSGHFPALDALIDKAVLQGFVYRVGDERILCTIQPNQEKQITDSNHILFFIVSTSFENAVASFMSAQQAKKGEYGAVP
jgi:hypothetical protein